MNTSLRRRLKLLEGNRPPPSPYDAMDPILAEMSTDDLISLLNHDKAVKEGRCLTDKQVEVSGTFWDRFRAAVSTQP